MDLAAATMDALQTFVGDMVDRVSKTNNSNELDYLRESFSLFADNVQMVLAKTNDTLSSPASALREDSVPLSAFQQAGGFDQGDPNKIAIEPPTTTEPDLARRPTPVSSFSRVPWSDEEAAKLIRLREGNEDILHEFPGRTVKSIRQRYYKMKPKNQQNHWKKKKTTVPNNFEQGDHDPVADEPTITRAPARWSKEDKEKLLQLRQGNGDGQSLWEDILDEFPNRSRRSLVRRHKALTDEIPDEPPEVDVDAIEDDDLLSDEDEYLEALPLLPEEIASRVLCPNSDRGCARWFATFADANHHGQHYCDKRVTEGPFRCPWADAVGCKQMFSSRSSITSHLAIHNELPVGNPFSCRRGCGTNWPNPYLLTAHELKCGLQKAPRNTTLIRMRLPSKSDKEERPSIIIVARTSGSYIPRSWYGGFATLEQGLQSWGAAHLVDYRRIFSDERAAVLHIGINVPTVYMPTGMDVNDHLIATVDASTKYGWRRANRFTGQIAQDLQAAPGRPTIVSIGSDGFSCNTSLIQPFLERVVSFDMVVRHNFIRYRNGTGPSLNETLLLRYGLCWWKDYRSECILQGLNESLPPGQLQEIDELIAWWAEQQRRKDLRREYCLVSGRNL
jgi:hypothetical protein